MRSIQRFIVRVAKEVVNTTTDNKYTYRFLVSTDGSMEDGAADDDEVLLKDDADEDNEENEENDVVMESDDEEGWIGFNGKDNKLPFV
ncbi:CFS_G0006600.mRNA.1.CDS.1 [Saccharomyces cerevisiae]|nr:CFS_G0006600.mRNA.1.CDS.1 [Saccharomyces cerevisiae]CAI7175156.1 CFS_G0006600.mRNA.1.CDS.1 [Saccharomyces cerevisiae]